MIRFFALFATFSLLGTTLLLAQPADLNLAASAIPAKLKEGAESVIRYQSTEYVADDDRTATLKYQKIVTLLSPENRENELVVHYADDVKLSRFRASLYDEYGEKIRDAKKSEIQDQMAVSSGQFYEDSRVQTLTLEHSEYPYTVVYEYELKMRDFGIIRFPQWRPVWFNQSCERAEFTAIVPAGNELLYDLYDLPEPERSRDGNEQIYQWRVKDLPVIRYEAQAPPASRVLPNVKTQLRNFRMDDYVGSFSDWESYGRFVGDLMKGRDHLPEDLRREVREVIAGATSTADKVDRLYRFLQRRMRYVGVQLGIGGFQPFSAEYVETNRFGDCKALSNYMGAILREAGVTSYPVLVYSGRPYYAVRPEFPTTSFNHMILYVPEEDMYLECTSNYKPTGYMGEGTHDRTVLHITPEGGKLAQTPSLEPTDHGHLRRVDLKVTPEGTAELNMRTRFFGARHDGLRWLYNAEGPEDRKKRLHDWELLPDLGGTDYRFTVAEDAPEAELTYRTEVERYARKMGKRLFVPLNKYFAYRDLPAALTERKLPVQWDESRFFVDSINVELPAGFEVESIGKETVVIDHEAGEYRSSISRQGNRIAWTRTLKLVPVNLPAEAYEGYRQFFIDVNKADRRQIVLKQKTTK